MLKITLAGLVIQGIISLETAELINFDLGSTRIPDTVEGVVSMINSYINSTER